MSDRPATTVPRKAGALDIRTIIGGLLGFYGIVLVIVGLVDSSHQDEKTGGVNANLWAGIALVVVAAAFLLWSRLRPVVIRPPAENDEPAGKDAGSLPG